jgi:hypothetical protein
MNTQAPRTVLQIYAAAVCFVSVGCFAIALGIVAYSIIVVIAPGLTASPMSLLPAPPAPRFSLSMAGDSTQPSSSVASVAPAPPSVHEIAKRKAEAMENGLRNEVIVSRQSLLRWGIVALISALLFATHFAHQDGRAVLPNATTSKYAR